MTNLDFDKIKSNKDDTLIVFNNLIGTNCSEYNIGIKTLKDGNLSDISKNEFNDITILKNPTIDEILIMFNLKLEDNFITLSLFNNDLQLINSKVIEVSSESKIINLKVNELSGGVYYLNVKGIKFGSKTKKILILN